MTASSQTPEAAGLQPCPFCGGEAEIIHLDDGDNAGGSCVCCTRCQASGNVEFGRKENFVENWNRRVTAASAQAAIDAEKAKVAELEAERDQIAGESIWWKTVIGDGEYTPSGEVPSIKHLHPAMVKPIYDVHIGTAVADVIAGLIFSRAITENREQFLVSYANDRATAAEARADRLAKALVDARDQFVTIGSESTDESVRLFARGCADSTRAALQQETQP